MAHVVLGRVVLGSGGGITVEGARADVVVTGPDGLLRERAVSASDGRFVVVYRYANVETVTFRLTSPTGVLIERRELPSPGDNQETTDDLGDIAMPDDLSAHDLVDSTPALPARPRISGRVVDRGGECSIHCLQVLVEAILTTAPDDAEHVPLAVARTDRTGRFFVDYTGGPFRVARARIPGLALPIPLPVTASGLIAPEPLLVIDLPEVEHAHETVGCECASSDVPRLPGQEQLAEDPSTYSADLGAGCVSFTTRTERSRSTTSGPSSAPASRRSAARRRDPILSTSGSIQTRASRGTRIPTYTRPGPSRTGTCCASGRSGTPTVTRWATCSTACHWLRVRRSSSQSSSGNGRRRRAAPRTRCTASP